MVKELFENIKKIDKEVLNFMCLGFNFCSFIAIISLLVLIFYIIYPITYLIYDCGIILFRTSLFFLISFFICAVVTSGIKKKIL